MPARDVGFRLGGGPWYGYWYGVILQVVDGVFTGFEYGHLKRISILGTAKQKMFLGRPIILKAV
jgi:hypothetical protein